MPADVEILSCTRRFEGHLALDQFRLRHRRYAGDMGLPVSREVLRRGAAVAVLLYDPGRDVVVLVEQFRIGAHVAGFPSWLVETVAGLVEPGESALDVARRETREEAGAELTAWIPVARYLPSPGCSDETVEILLGRVDATGLGGVHGLAEEGEDIRVLVMSREEALAACAAGRIVNAHTLVALQWLALNRPALDSRWQEIAPPQTRGEGR